MKLAFFVKTKKKVFIIKNAKNSKRLRSYKRKDFYGVKYYNKVK